MKLMKRILRFFFSSPKKTITHEAMIESERAWEEFKDMKAKALIGFTWIH